MKQVHRMVELRIFLWEQQQSKHATPALAHANLATDHETSGDTEEDDSSNVNNPNE